MVIIHLNSMLLALALCLALVAAYEPQHFPLLDVDFGIDEGNNTAWFRFENEKGVLVHFKDLTHLKGLFADEYETTTYSRRYSRAHWLTMTIISESEVTITIYSGGNVISVSPKNGFGLDVRSESLRRLQSSPYVISYTKTAWPMGSACIEKEVDRSQTFERTGSGLGGPIIIDSKGVDTEKKPSRRLQRPERWANCYPGESQTRYIDIGIVVDSAYYQIYYSDLTRTMKSIEKVIANTNLVYFYTFNIFVRVQQVLIPTNYVEPASPDLTFDHVLNQNLSTCGTISIGEALDGMSRFSEQLGFDAPTPLFPTTNRTDSRIVSLSHWHLLTACYFINVIGVAYVDTLCEFRLFLVDTLPTPTAVNVAVSSKTLDGVTWLTFAHELGHAFGAFHSFEEGQGITGGIMDYGDGTLNGIYQFNEKYRRGDFCSSLQFLQNTAVCQVGGNDYFPVASTQPCQGSETTCKDGTGLCIDGVCELAEMLLKITAENEDFYYAFQEARYGTSSFNSVQSTISAPVVVSDPLDGCAHPPQSDQYDGKIVLIRRGNCLFRNKSEIAEVNGAVAVVIMSNENELFHMAADNFESSIPSILVTRNSRDEIESLEQVVDSLNATLGLVVFPHADLTFAPVTSPTAPTTPPVAIPPTGSPLPFFTETTLYISLVVVGLAFGILAHGLFQRYRQRSEMPAKPPKPAHLTVDEASESIEP